MPRRQAKRKVNSNLHAITVLMSTVTVALEAKQDNLLEIGAGRTDADPLMAESLAEVMADLADAREALNALSAYTFLR